MRISRVIAATTVLVCSLALAGCGQASSSDSSHTSTAAANGDASQLPQVTGEKNKAPKIDAGHGDEPHRLISHVLRAGNGRLVTPSDVIKVNYTGQLWNGKKFDSSWDRGKPIQFPLSAVIPGWTAGLTGKRVGDRVELVIPPQLGYGSRDVKGIPRDSTLVFVVDILDAKSFPQQAPPKPSQSETKKK